MQKTLHLLILLLFTSATVNAQSVEETSVTDVINRLFTAMNKADSSMLRSTFANDVTMATAARNKEGNPVLRREDSINDFVKQVGSQKPGILAEEIWGLKIQIDGDFAQAWCDYAFYYDNKFSHCGVDAFHLFKTREGWKIFHLADTRRKDGCKVPDEIQKKHQ
ncbi:MAG TPA: nuclear transport factor 2 family protein [Cyclobacteriaceae bacterium]|nr:nuclear transport factor 2 family protein [Cyclobacteriaceae bacterium]